MIRLYMYEIASICDVELPMNLSIHTDQYKIEEKRRISRYAYFKLSEKLSSLGYNPTDITFTKKGKAVLDGIFFSISHSKFYISIVISDVPVGVDTEELIPDQRLGISSKILNEEEQREFISSLNKNEYLTQKWTLKEAYGKAIGVGLDSNVLSTSIKGISFRIKDSITSIVPEDTLEIYMNEERTNEYGKSK